MKNTIKIITTLAISALLLSGCSIFQGGGMTHRNANTSSTMIRASRYKNGNTVFNSFYDASKRSTVIVANDQNYTVLAENTPDAIFSKALEIVANADVSNKVNASATIDVAKTAMQLNKKSTTNIFSADALYRLNEMYINTLNIDSIRGDKAGKSIAFPSQILNADMYQKLFTTILCKAAEISKTEAEIANKQNFADLNASLEKLISQVTASKSKIDSASIRLDRMSHMADSTNKAINDRLKKLEDNK
jgi:hypothetical protein